MDEVRIKYSHSKLKKFTVHLWVTAVVAVIIFLIAKSAVGGGYLGVTLYGALLGAAAACAFMALSFTVNLSNRFNKSASIAVICKDGVRITDEPYNFGLVRWDNITGFKLKKTGILIWTRCFIAPVLSDPDAFLNALTKRKRKIAKQGKRFGSPALFDISNAELAPEEILGIFNSRLEANRGR